MPAYEGLCDKIVGQVLTCQNMSIKDIKARILSNIKIGPGYYKMYLEAPYIARLAKPGQFLQIRCNDSLEPFLRRPFSIHRIKGQESRAKGIEILYEVVGKGTEVLVKKKEGEFLDILGPLGNGFSLPRITTEGSPERSRVTNHERRTTNSKSTAIIIAGGIGAAPLVFLAEELAEKRIKTIVLLGAKTKHNILCERDFRKLGAEVHVATDDGTFGHKGFVTRLFQNIVKTLNLKLQTKVYACGPEPMLKNIGRLCVNQGIECQVSVEEYMACGIGACLGCVVKTKKGDRLVCRDGPVFNSSELLW